MKTCNDCLHCNLCEKRTCAECQSSYCDECGIYSEYDGRASVENCTYFKDKSLVLDLPCKVGDKIYQLDTAGNIYESEITKIIYDTNGIAFDSKAIGKCVFLSREAAEQALKGAEV